MTFLTSSPLNGPHFLLALGTLETCLSGRYHANRENSYQCRTRLALRSTIQANQKSVVTRISQCTRFFPSNTALISNTRFIIVQTPRLRPEGKPKWSVRDETDGPPSSADRGTHDFLRWITTLASILVYYLSISNHYFSYQPGRQ